MRSSIQPGDGDPRHGTRNGYINLACRCEPCKAAGREANAEQKRKRLARVAADPSTVPHGTLNGYTNYLCRCEPCVAGYRQARGYRGPQPPPAPCGTVAAYNRHLRHGEPACQPCKDAAATVRRRYRQKAAA